MKRFAAIFLLILLLLGCSGNKESSSVDSSYEEVVDENIIHSIGFPFDPVGIQWMNHDTLFLMGKKKQLAGEPQPLADQLFLFDVSDNELVRLNLSQIEGFDYSYYWNSGGGYNKYELFLTNSLYKKDRPYSENVIVKIPLNQPTAFETARYQEYFEEYRSTPSEQGKYIRSPKPVASNRFTIVDVFSGEEIDAQTDLLYQMEAAEISPDLTRLFIHHPKEDSHTFPWYHGEAGRLEGGSPEGFTGVFSMENGELLYLKSISEQNGILYWSQSGNYLLYINYDVEKHSFSVQVCRADDGKFLWEKSFENVRWRTHYLAGDFLYCISTIGKTLTLLDLSTGEITTTDFSDPVEEVGVSPDGTKAAVYYDGKIKVISLDQ